VKPESSEQLNANAQWLQPAPANASPQIRLFCLPHAGGGSIAFRAWNASLPSAIQVCPVLLPGRERRSAEPPFTQFDALIAAMDSQLRPWLDRPYAIFGHSMGSLLAFEWARKLAQDGLPQPAWMFLSGRCAPDTPPDAVPLHTLPDRQFLEELNRRYAGIPEEAMADPGFREVFLPLLRADISVVESYRFRPSEPLDCPITVFAGTSDRSVNWTELMGWKSQTRGRFAMHLLPGDHFYPQEPAIERVASTLIALCS
jgi:surfactin synthase thioesterase subunit